jgi:ribosomal protein S18 acetylase RimI-like enzyme
MLPRPPRSASIVGMAHEPTDAWPALRPAVAGDARALAELIDIAGEGIPSLLWAASAGPGRMPLDVGADRAARTGVNFCFENAIVAEAGGVVAGMLLGYPLDADDPGDLSQLPAVVRPLVRLECRAPGTWYVNAVATRPRFRGRGIGLMLLREAERLAARSGRSALSLIVASGNGGALRLYERIGFRTIAREPVVGHPGLRLDGDWLLMTRTIGAEATVRS